VIEEGGQLSGEIEFGTAPARPVVNGVRPGLQVHSSGG
jgi:hypothetical protein